MASGPEHYAAAERIVLKFQNHDGVLSAEQQIAAMGIAQVHATLALAAATVDSSEGSYKIKRIADWQAVTS